MVQGCTVDFGFSIIDTLYQEIATSQAPRNDIFSPGSKNRYQCVVVTREGQDPPLQFRIGTVYHSTGGLPHQCAHWFAMTC